MCGFLIELQNGNSFQYFCTLIKKPNLGMVRNRINDGRGPVVHAIQKIYHDAICGKVDEYEKWCEYIG